MHLALCTGISWDSIKLEPAAPATMSNRRVFGPLSFLRLLPYDGLPVGWQRWSTFCSNLLLLDALPYDAPPHKSDVVVLSAVVHNHIL